MKEVLFPLMPVVWHIGKAQLPVCRNGYLIHESYKSSTKPIMSKVLKNEVRFVCFFISATWIITPLCLFCVNGALYSSWLLVSCTMCRAAGASPWNSRAGGAEVYAALGAGSTCWSEPGQPDLQPWVGRDCERSCLTTNQTQIVPRDSLLTVLGRFTVVYQLRLSGISVTYDLLAAAARRPSTCIHLRAAVYSQYIVEHSFFLFLYPYLHFSDK